MLLLFAFDVKGSAAARSFPPRAQSGWLRQLAVEQTLTTRARYRTCNDLTAHGSIALNSGPRPAVGHTLSCKQAFSRSACEETIAREGGGRRRNAELVGTASPVFVARLGFPGSMEEGGMGGV
ncbi:unnamed protein product [Rangifer tarandus platyrhynchus]|uniref:Uncharacterized protein n=1 Tax=Rangifer tarandus platyrhynchus TaxID=3082113 RepID=A0ACB1KD92_RANTA